MSDEKNSGWVSLVSALLWSDRSVTGLFLLLLVGLGGAATYLLSRDGNGWVLLVALVAGLLLLGLEHLENSRIAGGRREWRLMPGYIAPLVIITSATLIACSPALNRYFSWDDFAYVRLFHTPSLSHFLRLFHTDLSQGVWGQSMQELRPLYGFFYMLSCSLWGIHPLGYHVSGILLHIIVSIMVFLIAKSFGPGESWRAGFAGLLFAVLPAHSVVISWANASLTEAIPTLFYLSAFLCFVCYRRTGLTRYLILSTTAFTVCLLSKETAVTLPFMLVSYDLFRMIERENSISGGSSAAGKEPWRRLVLPHVPSITLLLAYVGWRRIVFSSFLKENTWTWTSHAQGEASNLIGFLHKVAQVAYRSTAFNFQNLLLPFPTLILGLVLGLYLFWTFSLLRRRCECRRSIEVIVYFGGLWYLIASTPLLATYPSSHHLYIPSVGPCIATAFLAAPVCAEFRRRVRYLRLLAATLLICLCTCQLWKENSQWARQAKESASANGQLAAALEPIPKQSLVIIWPAVSSLVTNSWGGMFPYALQRPFTSTDLYSPARIIEPLSMDSFPVSGWWEKAKLALNAQSAGPLDDKIEIYLLAWDERRQSFEPKKCVLSRSCFEARITKSLGGPVEEVTSLRSVDADKFLEALASLVRECR